MQMMRSGCGEPQVCHQSPYPYAPPLCPWPSSAPPLLLLVSPAPSPTPFITLSPQLIPNHPRLLILLVPSAPPSFFCACSLLPPTTTLFLFFLSLLLLLLLHPTRPSDPSTLLPHRRRHPPTYLRSFYPYFFLRTPFRLEYELFSHISIVHFFPSLRAR